MSLVFVHKAGKVPRNLFTMGVAGVQGALPAWMAGWGCRKVQWLSGQRFSTLAYGFLSDSYAHPYIKALLADQYRAYQGYQKSQKLVDKEELGIDLLAGAIFACCFQISLKAWNRQLPSWKDLGKTASYGVATRVVAYLFQVVANLF
ncbi:MAG: hypothetical protein HYZ47_01585 [Simkania negevensis]|nr:hypothetical protein [Simkania negevensis]